MRLKGVLPWTTAEEVLTKMDFEPLIADKLEEVAPPTQQELDTIRAEIDPGGFSTSKGEWFTIDAATGKKVG